MPERRRRNSVPIRAAIRPRTTSRSRPEAISTPTVMALVARPDMAATSETLAPATPVNDKAVATIWRRGAGLVRCPWHQNWRAMTRSSGSSLTRCRPVAISFFFERCPGLTPEMLRELRATDQLATHRSFERGPDPPRFDVRDGLRVACARRRPHNPPVRPAGRTAGLVALAAEHPASRASDRRRRG